MPADLEAMKALLAKVEAGEWIGDLPRPQALHTDLVWKAFNGSLDAAHALHKAALPGWRVYDFMEHVRSDWTIDLESLSDDMCVSAMCPGQPARAWLIAILKALIAEADA